MKKILFLVVLLLFPITVFAKTPNKEETLNVIRGIKNVTVDDSISIESTRIEDNNIILTILADDEYIPYEFSDNKLSFAGGYLLLDSNNQVIGEPADNEYAFFLYSILENKSNIPYDANNYYNNDTIKAIVNNGFSTEYKENTNTFGFSLKEVKPGMYQIIYNYYTDGDYPIVATISNVDDVNPATGNYNILITIMLISILCLAIYSYLNRERVKS